SASWSSSTAASASTSPSAEAPTGSRAAPRTSPPAPACSRSWACTAATTSRWGADGPACCVGTAGRPSSGGARRDEGGEVGQGALEVGSVRGGERDDLPHRLG